MGRVVHFEIHAEDPERAAAFYRGVFGWSVHKWGEVDYWLVGTGPDDQPGINGAILPRRGKIDGVAVIAYVCTIDVADLDAAMADAARAGATLALAKMPVPGIGWLAYMKDTEGNIFGMMQTDTAVSGPGMPAA